MSSVALPLAIVGMAGAGKSRVAEFVVDQLDYERVYFGQVVLDELAARDMTPGPDAERLVREQLRREEGMDVMAKRSLPRVQAALSAGHGVCIDGLYSAAEWEFLVRETGVVTLAVHAPRWLRKSRLAERAVRPLTGAELDARDLAEVQQLDKARPIALADAHVVNDAGLPELHARVAAVLDHADDLVAGRLRDRSP